MHFAVSAKVAGVCLTLFGAAAAASAQPAHKSGSPLISAPASIRIFPLNFVKIDHSVLHWQETDEWCWAASGQMVMEEAGNRTVPQCYEANQLFGRTDCCSCPTPAACISGGWPQWNTWGYNYKTANPFAWGDLTAEIDAGRPFAFAWGWNGGGGHMMAAYGYSWQLLGLGEFVYVDDPWGPQGRCGPGGNASGPFGGEWELITYADFLGGPGYNHVFWGADYDVTPQ